LESIPISSTDKAASHIDTSAMLPANKDPVVTLFAILVRAILPAMGVTLLVEFPLPPPFK